MRGKALAVLCLAAIAWIAVAAEATTLRKLGDAEMVEASGAIVLGQAVAAEYRSVAGSVMTLVRIEVGEVLKGSAAGELTVVVPGGIDSSRAVPVAVVFPGAPTLVNQENVLLFLADSGVVAGAYEVVGFNQGKFSVVEGPAGTSLAVGQGRTMPLESKKQQIRHHLKGAK